MALDTKDCKILGVIEMDSRMSYQQIGKRTGLSKESVIYRMHRLEEKGIIQGYKVLINFGKLGYTGFGVYNRFQNLNEKLKKEIIEYLRSIPELYWVGIIGGKFDLVFGIMSKSVFEFNKIYHKIMNKYGAYLVDNTIAIRTELHQNRRDYLLGEKKNGFTAPFFGKEIELEKIDELDKRILNEISMNARLSLVDLSHTLKKPASTISLRMKNLESRGIIQAFWTYIKAQNYGMQSYRLLLSLNHENDEVRTRLFEYAYHNPKAILAIETVGPWSFEMTFEVGNQEELQEEITKLRDEFKEIIQKIEFITMFEDNLIYDPYPLLKGRRKINA